MIIPSLSKGLRLSKLLKNLPTSLIAKCQAEKENIAGVLQLWIYITKDYKYGDVKAIGLVEEFQGSEKRLKALMKLMKALDSFSKEYQLKFVEARTRIIPPDKMKRFGFEPAKERSTFLRLMKWMVRDIYYVKKY